MSTHVAIVYFLAFVVGSGCAVMALAILLAYLANSGRK